MRRNDNDAREQRRQTRAAARIIELEREVARLKDAAPKLFAIVEEMRRHTDPMGGASGRMVGRWADDLAAVRADMAYHEAVDQGLARVVIVDDITGEDVTWVLLEKGADDE